MEKKTEYIFTKFDNDTKLRGLGDTLDGMVTIRRTLEWRNLPTGTSWNYCSVLPLGKTLLQQYKLGTDVLGSSFLPLSDLWAPSSLWAAPDRDHGMLTACCNSPSFFVRETGESTLVLKGSLKGWAQYRWEGADNRKIVYNNSKCKTNETCAPIKYFGWLFC